MPLNARLTLEAKSDNETTAVELVKEIQKRLTPEQLSSILASEKASALRAAGNTAVATQTNAVSLLLRDARRKGGQGSC